MGNFHKQTKITKIEKKGEGFLIKGVGQEFYADEVVIATSAIEAANLVEGKAAELLLSIPYRAITAAHVLLEGNKKKLKGFGYLTTSSSEEKILGALFDENLLFTPMDKMTFMLKGSLSKQEAEKLVLLGLKEHLKMDASLKKLHVQSYDAAIPQYLSGHREKVKDLRKALPKGVHLLGNYLEGVSVSDSIALSKKLAKAI